MSECAHGMHVDDSDICDGCAYEREESQGSELSAIRRELDKEKVENAELTILLKEANKAVRTLTTAGALAQAENEKLRCMVDLMVDGLETWGAYEGPPGTVLYERGVKELITKAEELLELHPGTDKEVEEQEIS